ECDMFDDNDNSEEFHRMLNDDNAYGSSNVINHGDHDFDVD
ncbi:12887_t:CDS:2, partial [Gigaspora margarita]